MPADPMYPVDFSHLLLAAHLRPGASAVDATAGNGHDTVFLARQVGPHGRIYAFDIQKRALAETRCRLREVGLTERVVLIHDGHEKMREYVDEVVGGVVFNLGYLPGGDKTIVTRPETTLAALDAALELLAPGGVVVFVVYTGHSGGKREGRELRSRAAQLPASRFQVLQQRFLNVRKSCPPELVAIRRRGS